MYFLVQQKVFNVYNTIVMKYAIFYKAYRENAASFVDKLVQHIDQSRFIRDDENPEAVIVVGGDGTFLSAVHHYIDKLNNIIFINFKRGFTSFYLDFEDEDLNKINDLLDGKYEKMLTLPLLKAKIGAKKFYAVNEFTLGSFMKASGFEIYINDYYLESTYGSGLLVCTPFGSSGYNKSLGGAILDPNSETFEVTEMASIQSKKYKSLDTSIVLKKDSIVKIKYIDTHSLTLTYDNQSTTLDALDVVEIKYSKKQIKVYSKEGCTFFDKLKKAF